MTPLNEFLAAVATRVALALLKWAWEQSTSGRTLNDAETPEKIRADWQAWLAQQLAQKK